MQFVVIGRDGDDVPALQRRTNAREAHLTQCASMKNTKTLLYAAALKDENNNMNGSIMIVDFASRSELDAWLEREPYVIGKVWKQVEVTPCAVAPIFAA